MKDVMSMKVDELRTALLDMGLSPDLVAASDKKTLQSLLVQELAKEEKFDLDPISWGPSDLAGESKMSVSSGVSTLEEAIGVKYASPEWQQYVMGLFNPEELVDGCPKCNGLRRVASVVLGDIVESSAKTIAVLSGDGGRSVTIGYEILIDWKLNRPVGFFGKDNFCPTEFRRFGGVADCSEDATVFGKHPAATAESKAESRALRKALALNVVTAEEKVTGADEELPRAKNNSNITNPLKEVIKAKAKAFNLDLNESLAEFKKDAKSLDDLTMDQGRAFFDFIVKKHQI